jgi:uncharacterized protein YndB with AHSA1/START domain
MTTEHEMPRVVSASCEIAAGPEQVFELIADPAQQPRWDGNDNLGEAAAGQRVHRVGDLFNMTLTGGAVRENHVVDPDRALTASVRPSQRPRCTESDGGLADAGDGTSHYY